MKFLLLLFDRYFWRIFGSVLNRGPVFHTSGGGGAGAVSSVGGTLYYYLHSLDTTIEGRNDGVMFSVSGHDSQRPPWVPESVVDSVEAARGLLRFPHPKGVEVPQTAQHGERLHRRAPHRRRGRRGHQQQQPTPRRRPRPGESCSEVAQVPGGGGGGGGGAGGARNGSLRVRSSPPQPAAAGRQ